MDWDWHLTIEIATLIVAATGTALIWAERIDRRRQRGVATQPRPLCRIVDGPSGPSPGIEVSNPGGAAPACCVIAQFDDRLFSGNFSLADQQPWAAQTLEEFDVIPQKSVAPYVVASVASDAFGHWSATGPGRFIEGLVSAEVPSALSRLLLRATGRHYRCEISAAGQITPHRILSAAATA